MKNKLYRYEEDFRNKVQGEQIAPPDFIWDNIQSELKKSNRKPFLPFFMIGLLFVVIGGGIYLFSVSASSATQHPLTTDSSPYPNPSDNVGAEITTPATLQHSTNESSNETNHLSTIKAAATPSNNFIVNSTHSATTYHQNNQTETNSLTKTTDKQTLNTSSEETASISKEVFNTVASYPSKKADVLSAIPTTIISNEQVIEKSIPLQPLKHYALTEELPIDLTLSPLEIPSSRSLTPCPDWTIKKKKKWSFFVEPYIGYGLQQQKIETNPSLADSTGRAEAFTLSRKITEKAVDHRQVGILAGLQYKSFSLRTGVQYQQLNNLFEYDIQNWVNEFGQVGFRHIKWTNTHYLVDIPLVAGYEMQWNRIKLQVLGGTIFNLQLRNNNGFMMNSELVPERISSDQNPFVSSLGAGLVLQAGVDYLLYKNVSVFARPTYTNFLKNWSANNQLPKTYYNQFGLQAGVKIRLGAF